MKGLMMDFQPTLPTDPQAAETYFPHQQIVTRMPDRASTPTRSPISAGAAPARGRAEESASSAATASGRSAGTTTSTWRHTRDPPCGGFVLHTLNLRLHPNDLAYIATHAGDRP